MLATSRMWPSTRWMHAVSWRQLRAGAPARKRRLGRPMPFQTTFPHGRFHHVHAFSLRPIRRWPCLIRSGRAVEVAAVEVAAVEVVVAEVEAVVQVEVAREEEEGAAPAVVARAVVARAVVVKAAPAEVVVPEEAVEAAPAAGAREAAHAVALAVAETILGPIILTIRPTISRGQSCRHSHLRLRPTSRSWLRWRKGRADSQFSTLTTCWVDSSASDENKTNSTSWGTCPATPRKEAATR